MLSTITTISKRHAWRDIGVVGGLALVLLIAGACHPPSTFEVRRSAIVPAATPIERTGRSMGRNMLEGFASAETLGRVGEPEAGDGDPGVALPNQQFRAGLRFRPPQLANVDFGVSYQHLPSRGAFSLADQPVPGENGGAISSTVHVAFPLGTDGFHVGFAAQMTAYSLPYLIYQRCVFDCGQSQFEQVTKHRDTIPGFAAAILPNYQYGRFTLHGGLTARTQPTIDRVEIVTGVNPDVGGPTIGGPAIVFHAGFEAELPLGFRAGLRVHQTTVGGPIDDVPTFSAVITVPLVRAAEPPRPTVLSAK